MALPTQDLFKISIGGAVSGTESWSVGCWVEPLAFGTDPTPTQMNTLAANALGHFNTDLWSLASFGLKTFNNTSTTLVNCRAYHYRGGLAIGVGTASIAAVPGSGGAPQPGYVSRCLTLQSDLPGRSHRGRIYYPWNGQAPTPSSGMWSAASSTLTGMKNCLADIVIDVGAACGSVSNQLAVVSSAHGFTSKVTALRLDNKPDTQRGRNQSVIPSNYDSVTF